MGRRCGRRRHGAGCGLRELRLAGALLLAVGLVLLFLCIPGWAWAALLGAVLTALGLWLATLGVR